MSSSITARLAAANRLGFVCLFVAAVKVYLSIYRFVHSFIYCLWSGSKRSEAPVRIAVPVRAGARSTSPTMDLMRAALFESTQRSNAAAADTCVDFSLTLGAPLRSRYGSRRAGTGTRRAGAAHAPLPKIYSSFYVAKYKNR